MMPRLHRRALSLFAILFATSILPCEWQGSSAVAPASAALVATIYKDANFSGAFQPLSPGRYGQISSFPVGNDQISSLRVPSGWQVTLYEHANFSGRQKVFTGDASYVGDDFNDQASSMVIETSITLPPPPLTAVLYRDGFSGPWQAFPPGRYPLIPPGPVGNDQTSAVKLPSGWRITLFEHANFEGRMRVYASDAGYVGNDFNDLASSMIVETALELRAFSLPRPPVPAAPPMRQTSGALGKADRAVLVVSAGLTKYSGRDSGSLEDRAWRGLYDFLQSSGSSTAQNQLGPLYAEVIVLDVSRNLQSGTVANFASQLANLTSRYKAVDLIIHCHGDDRKLTFEDGEFNVDSLATALMTNGKIKVDGVTRTVATLNDAARGRLRMVLETACYGSSHRAAWRRLGFAVAAGARAVHADSWVSFPTFMNWWCTGHNFGETVTAMNISDPARITDHAAAPWFPTRVVDSFRETDGNLQVDISTMTAAEGMRLVLPQKPPVKIR